MPQVTVGGITLIALPPGPVDLHVQRVSPLIGFAPRGGGAIHELIVDGKRVDATGFEAGAVDAYPSGMEVRLVCTNHDWEALIEIEPGKLAEIERERFDGAVPPLQPIPGQLDPVSQTISALAIDALREKGTDPLFLEGLALALISRTFSLMPDMPPQPSTKGNRGRVRRAVDLIESEPHRPFSVASLADVAGMSASWFARSFKAETGWSVYSYVLERRLQRARSLIESGGHSLARIAHLCGFHDHAHLSRSFRKRFGVPPSDLPK